MNEPEFDALMAKHVTCIIGGNLIASPNMTLYKRVVNRNPLILYVPEVQGAIHRIIKRNIMWTSEHLRSG